MGVCGKKSDTTELQDKLTGALIGPARATEGNNHMVTDSTAAVLGYKEESIHRFLYNALFAVDMDDCR